MRSLEQRRRTGILWLAIVLAVAAAIVGLWLDHRSHQVDDASLQGRVLSIAGHLRVPNEHDTMTVANSPEPLAQHMRYEIQQDLLAGQSPSRIIVEMRSEYGDAVLAAPSFSGTGRLVWLLPAVVLVIFALAWGLYLRRSRMASTDSPKSSDASVKQAIDETIAKRMKEYL